MEAQLQINRVVGAANIARTVADAKAGRVKVGPKRPALKFYGNNLKMLESTEHQVILAGSAECVAGETLVYDPLSGASERIEDIYRVRQRPIVLTMQGPVKAEVPFIKGTAALYRLLLKSGKSCLATARHRVLGQQGWCFVSDLYVGDVVLASDVCRLPSSSASYLSGLRANAPRSLGIAQDYQDHYLNGHRLDDAEPLPAIADDLAFQPLRVDVRERSHDYRLAAVPCRGEQVRSHLYQLSVRLSSSDYAPYPFAEHKEHGELNVDLETSVLYADLFRDDEPFPQLADRLTPFAADGQSVDSRLHWLHRLALSRRDEERQVPADNEVLDGRPPSSHLTFPDRYLEPVGTLPRLNVWASEHSPKVYYTVQWDEIASIEYERTDVFYDLHVPGAEHYLADGIWHHNTGKTYVCCEKLHRLCKKYKGVQAAIVRKSYTDMPGTVLQTFARIAGNEVKVYGGEKPQWYDYPNGSRVWVGGMDHPGKVLSSERDFVYVNQTEELELADWETLTTRVTGRAGNVPTPQVIGDCNPGMPTHWIKTGGVTVIESRHEDNPRLFDQATGKITPQGELSLSILDRLTGPRKARLRYGQWAGAEGMVYEDSWDAKRNLIDRFEIPQDWRRYWVIDFGFTNPFCWQAWAEDPDGRLYRYREIYHTQRLVEDHTKHILAVTVNDPRPDVIICDHDAEGRATFEKYSGLSTTAAQKEVLEGIQAVASRLRSNGDGKARMFLLRESLVERDQSLRDKHKPTCTEEEIEGYIWKESAKKEEPLKENDHGCDAVRYMAAFLDFPQGGFAVHSFSL